MVPSNEAPLDHFSKLANAGSQVARPETSALCQPMPFGFDYDPDAIFFADAVVASFAFALVSWCLFKHFRCTAGFALAWTSWFTYKVVTETDAGASWRKFTSHASDAHIQARRAVIAIYETVVDLAIVLLPFFEDAHRAVIPYVLKAYRQAAHFWQSLSPRQRCIVCSVVFAIVVTVVAAAFLWKHRATLRIFLFHLSFIFFGPLIWFSVLQLSHLYAAMLADTLMTLVPILVSIRIHMELDDERRQHRSGENIWSWDTQMMRSGIRDRLRSWLSFFVLWPYLRLAHLLLETLDDDKRSPGDATVVSMVVWAQWWSGSWASLYLLRCVASRCAATQLGSTTQQVIAVARSHASSASAFVAPRLVDAVTVQNQKVQIVLMVVLGVILLSVCLFALKAVSALIVFALLCAASFDSARWAARDDTLTDEICASRLAFWIVALTWMKLDALSTLNILSLWTPVVVAAALPLGETIVTLAMIPVIRIVVDQPLRRSASSGDQPASPGRSRSTSLPVLAVHFQADHPDGPGEVELQIVRSVDACGMDDVDDIAKEEHSPRQASYG